MIAGMWTRDELLVQPTVHFSYRWQIQFQDIDAAGIVFFARILGACHEAYMRFWLSQGKALREALAHKEWATPLVHAEGDFLRPMRFGDEVDVQLVGLHATERKLYAGYRIVQASDQQPTAVAQTVHVYVSLKDFVRVSLPQEALPVLQPFYTSVGEGT